MFSFLRVVKFALQDMARNFGLSLMTILILILMLLSVNTLWSVEVLTSEAVGLVKDQINVSLFLVSDITDENVQELEEYIGSFPQVVDLNISSREEVLKDFEIRHEGQIEVLEALKELEGNPFGPTMIIKTNDPSEYKSIIEALDVPEYEYLIESKSFEGHEDAIGRLNNITNRIEQMGFGLTVLFAAIAFLIIFNTIRVAIYTQRVEIGIKRLVGASNWFIRGPYVIESIFFTIISIGISSGVIFAVLHWVDPYLSIVFPNSFTLTNYYSSHIIWIFGLQTLAVFLLTIISSLLAMRKQLKI